MKSDAVFGLENANWPVLLLDQTSTICRANQSAVKLFGTVLEGTSPLLSAVWGPRNHCPAEQFLAQWERAPSPVLSLKYRVKGGGSTACSTSICAFDKDGQKYFLLQLHPESLAQPAEAKHQPSDVGLAHKQKLECALQLARTVAMDFNNALTSILGHTSLLLSKAEPHHPWRASLLEVEKSAAKAADRQGIGVGLRRPAPFLCCTADMRKSLSARSRLC